MIGLNIQIKLGYILHNDDSDEYFKVTSVTNKKNIIVTPLVLDDGEDLKDFIVNIRTNKAAEFYTFFELRRLGFSIRVDK